MTDPIKQIQFFRSRISELRDLRARVEADIDGSKRRLGELEKESKEKLGVSLSEIGGHTKKLQKSQQNTQAKLEKLLETDDD